MSKAVVLPFFAALVALAGCGGSDGAPLPDARPSAGTYAGTLVWTSFQSGQGDFPVGRKPATVTVEADGSTLVYVDLNTQLAASVGEDGALQGAFEFDDPSSVPSGNHERIVVAGKLVAVSSSREGSTRSAIGPSETQVPDGSSGPK